MMVIDGVHDSAAAVGPLVVAPGARLTGDPGPPYSGELRGWMLLFRYRWCPR